jgi:hypothetical protein
VCAIETGTNPEVLGALLVEGARLVVGGHTGHGKTTVVMQMVKAISTGGEFLGYQGSGGRVLVVDLGAWGGVNGGVTGGRGVRGVRPRLRVQSSGWLDCWGVHLCLR